MTAPAPRARSGAAGPTPPGAASRTPPGAAGPTPPGASPIEPMPRDAASPVPWEAATPPDTAPSPVRRLGPQIDVDRDGVERGLGSLVLTIIELLRQLMERQALRRIDQGDLTDEQIERVGATLMALEEQMTELREHFGLSAEDLNLDLGPLGPLLPRT